MEVLAVYFINIKIQLFFYFTIIDETMASFNSLVNIHNYDVLIALL